MPVTMDYVDVNIEEGHEELSLKEENSFVERSAYDFQVDVSIQEGNEALQFNSDKQNIEQNTHITQTGSERESDDAEEQNVIVPNEAWIKVEDGAGEYEEEELEGVRTETDIEAEDRNHAVYSRAPTTDEQLTYQLQVAYPPRYDTSASDSDESNYSPNEKEFNAAEEDRESDVTTHENGQTSQEKTAGSKTAKRPPLIRMSKRKDLTLAEKIALLDKIKSQPPNSSQRKLSETLRVAKSTIARLIKQQDELRHAWASREWQQGTSQKRKREGKDPGVEEALKEWFSIVIGRGVRISGPMLKSKAEEFAIKLGRNDFQATDGWLSRWKARNAIKYKKGLNEKGRADFVSADHWKSTVLPNLLQQFSADDIYNADETCLLYRCMPDGSLVYKREILVGSTKAKDCLTVLCCANMSGSDKRKLLVIGRRAKPRCFKGLRLDGLPVIYRSNKDAWMTSEIFEQWLKNWNAELQLKSRKILLLLDNCAVHPHFDFLNNIQMEFFPPNTTSLTQPMEVGIIKNLKTKYRTKLVNYTLEAIEENLCTSSSTAKEIGARVTVLQAIQYVADSWRAIDCETIKNCFARVGFQHSGVGNAETALVETETVLSLQRVTNAEEFLCVDENLQCYEGNHLEDIVDQIVAKHRKVSDESASDDDDMPERVKHEDAMKCIADLRRYFMQEGNENSPMSALDQCYDFAHVKSVESARRSTLNKIAIKRN